MRTLKTIFLATAALTALSISAMAADAIIEQPPEPAAPVEVAPQYTWAGGYTGLYGGYSWGKFDTDAVGEIKDNAPKLGAYAGWNFQQDNFVYGVEGDAGYSWLKEEKLGLEAKQGFEGSLRARLGYAMDPALLYVTGGVAGAKIELDDGVNKEDKFRAGWTVGAGAEAFITQNIIGRVEYRYTDFGDKDYDLGASTVSSDLKTHDIRLGVGYKF
ncbi:outer membrane protein [Mesorhizobium sp. RMAD-H1]|uniref:outer membrane protein n=1 Tax=Mesorhizobium sp. RMAD-H1 TaxID=2587065 RepID=UPI00161941B3|nr:outer membrane protein [Mesorhizobium sp. RMAD-H1]MBB2970419.1 outer membrane immunogenic protein [Mesorhizobium sp. RMAD-H1]